MERAIRSFLIRKILKRLRRRIQLFLNGLVPLKNLLRSSVRAKFLLKKA
jgi:hypothetical protein